MVLCGLESPGLTVTVGRLAEPASGEVVLIELLLQISRKPSFLTPLEPTKPACQRMRREGPGQDKETIHRRRPVTCLPATHSYWPDGPHQDEPGLGAAVKQAMAEPTASRLSLGLELPLISLDESETSTSQGWGPCVQPGVGSGLGAIDKTRPGYTLYETPMQRPQQGTSYCVHNNLVLLAERESCNYRAASGMLAGDINN